MLIQRTRDPVLRRTFEDMRHFHFVNYIVGARIRHGTQQKYDVEDCLQRICFRMLSPVGERGLPKDTLFDVDLNGSYNLEVGNPLRARFCTFLMHELRNIMGDRIPALRRTPITGTLSIGYGKETGEVSPDQIPARAASGEQEMLNDIIELLKRRSVPGMPLVDLFQSILRGEGTRIQRSRFGFTTADAGRKMIVQVIQQYAYQSRNWHLLRLLDRFRDFSGNNPDLARPKSCRPQKPPKPTYWPDEQDYRSIVDVLEKHGRSASMMVFGKVRRRWLERPPRDPASVHPNGLGDVLARMVEDGVLRKVGMRYVPARGVWPVSRHGRAGYGGVRASNPP